MRTFVAAPALLVIALAAAACAPKPPAAKAHRSGTVTNMSRASTENWEACPHEVPKENCALCNPELAPKFKAAGDWCSEHDRPESQCLICNPSLTFDPMPALAASADVAKISEGGVDVPSLEAHLAPGKVTVFDFYADWCVPCREVDAHMFEVVNRRSDVALRKIDVSTWDSPVAKRYMAKVPGLPYLIVYGKDGQLVARIFGLRLEQLDEAIAEGGAR